MARHRIDPQRRAEFKELARNIVNTDRFARKHGASQNTIGEIERALVSAFLDGKAYAGRTDVTDDVAGLTWIQIPSRSRDTLQSMTFGFSKMAEGLDNTPLRIERFQQAGKWRWREVSADGTRAEHSVADGSARPLISLELIELCDDEENLFQLTEQAIHICRDYWKRSDDNDPTLPKISLR